MRDAVEARTGPVSAARNVPEGLNCSLALTAHSRDSGPLFLKGVRTTDAAAVASLRCEQRINPAVRGVGPAIRHSFEAGGWFCLAFAHVEGRHADLSPDTGDQTAVALVLGRMQGLRAPRFPVPQLADRLAPWLLPGEADALRGTALLHTDTNPHNILVRDRDGAACVVDWAMPARGPSWIDPASTAVRLMECGHSPAAARAWLSGFSSWLHAAPRAVESFVNATCRQWSATVGMRAAQPSNDRFRQLLDFPHRPDEAVSSGAC
nr:phosphotransferase [Streptomyces boncukensis]